MKKKEDIFVHFGGSYSGPAPKEFLNFDSSPTLRFERIPLIGKTFKKNKNFFPSNVKCGDIIKGLPLQNNTIKGVYCSHVLEHLSLLDLRKSLKNVYKILKKGGIFRAVLPDLRQYCFQYTKGEIDSVDFLKLTGLGTVDRKRSLKEILKNHFGGSRHLWMWDFTSLTNELYSCGFEEVREADFNDSIYEEFKLVETESRWKNEPVLGFEAKK